MIRYYCHTDADGPRADFCARYAEAFVAMSCRLRILPVEIPAPALALQYVDPKAAARRAPSPNRWLRLRPFFVTPVNEPFVNVVCSDPFWWARLYTVGVRNVLITGETPRSIEAIKGSVPASARMAAGERSEVVNGEKVDFALLEMPPTLPDPRDAAIRYSAIVVPSEEVAAAWRALIDDQQTREMDTVESSAQAPDVCQVVVVGLDLAERVQVLKTVMAVG